MKLSTANKVYKFTPVNV